MNVIPLKSDAYVRYVCIFFNWFQPSWRTITCMCKHSGAVDAMHVNVAFLGMPCSPTHGIMLLTSCFCVAWRWRCGFTSAWFSIWCNCAILYVIHAVNSANCINCIFLILGNPQGKIVPVLSEHCMTNVYWSCAGVAFMLVTCWLVGMLVVYLFVHVELFDNGEYVHG